MASVELRGLTKRYGDLAVVDNVSLTIEHGRLVCLLGPSGCGKTTTLRMIAGFVEPSAGEIRVGDKLVSSPARTMPPERRNMSMIFQSYALWPHMTVAENVAYGLKLRKLDRETIKRKLVGDPGHHASGALADRYPGELSGGQQQRVALARALIVEPEMLLLDEPLSNLDANLREEMRFEVRRLHDEYRYTTVYVTHDQSEAMTTADVIAVMNLGKIEQAGSPEDIYDRPRSEFVARFIGSSNVFKGPALDESHLSTRVPPCDAPAAGSSRAAPVRWRSASTSSVWGEEARDNGERGAGKGCGRFFCGSGRDYLVEMPDRTQLRVVTSAAENIPHSKDTFGRLPEVELVHFLKLRNFPTKAFI